MVLLRTNTILKTNSTIKTDVPIATISPLDPLSIVTSKSPIFYLNGDLGITIGTGVSAWADQTVNGRNAVQATAGNQPTYNASGLGGRGTVTFDGVDDVLVMSYIPPAPGTTASWYWIVFNTIVSATSCRIFASSATTRHTLFWNPTTTILMNNTTSVNSMLQPRNVWYRGEVSLTNSTSDYLKIGSTSVTGANAGNNAGTVNFCIGAATSTPTFPSNTAIAAIGAWNGEPTSGEKAALDAWVTSYYGAGVSV